MSLIPRGFLVAQCDRCQLMLEVDGSEIVFDDINEAVSYMNDREWIVVHEYGEDGFGLVVCDGCSQQCALPLPQRLPGVAEVERAGAGRGQRPQAALRLGPQTRRRPGRQSRAF